MEQDVGSTGLWMSQRQAALYYGVSANTLRNWDCPRVAIGRSKCGLGVRWRYHIPEVDAWLAKRAEGCVPPAEDGEARVARVRAVRARDLYKKFLCSGNSRMAERQGDAPSDSISEEGSHN